MPTVESGRQSTFAFPLLQVFLNYDFLQQFPVLSSGRVEIKIAFENLDVEQEGCPLGRVENDRVSRRDPNYAVMGFDA
jgi:hypothetical protein